MLRRIGLIFLSLQLLVVGLLAQEKDSIDSLSGPKNTHVISSIPYQPTQKMHYSLSIGTGFYAGSTNYYGNYTTIAPSLNYQATPKLNIEVGGVLSRGYNNYLKVPSFGNASNLAYQSNQVFIYSQGNYMLSNKLALTGSVFTTVNSGNSATTAPFYQDYKGATMGLNYKITNSMFIGAQFNVTHGNYLYNQYGMPFATPFHQMIP
jgi:hypothetical protein